MDHQSPEVNATTLLQVALSARLTDIANAVFAATGDAVQSGPFKGLRLPRHCITVPTLLGCYEQELHESIETAISRLPDRILNIGCGFGYYAVGLKMRLPGAWVGAYDISKDERHRCSDTAALNDRDISIDAAFTGTFEDDSGFHRLIFMDCEGAEAELITPDVAPYLKDTDLIIECHEFARPGITSAMASLLSATHDVSVIREAGRDTAVIPAVATMGSFDRSLAVCEFRPSPMHWITAWCRK